MNIVDTDSAFYDNLSRQMYNRRDFVMSLIDEIRRVSDISELERVVACGKSNYHLVYNDYCDVYFEVLEGNRVRMLNFAFRNDYYDETRG